jgi:hypothetical protein
VTATAELWELLARPFNPAGALEAMTGMPPAVAAHIVDLAIATAPETDLLLDHMHETLRSLAIATSSTPIRTVNEIRGPVLWSETVAARSSSPGAADVYICISPSKAYDTDENRVLVNALRRVREAARSADPNAAQHSDESETLLRRARHNGTRAIRALEHRTLATVTPGKADGRALRKARSGSKARSYRTAVAVLEYCAEPIGPDEIIARSDEHTRRQHELVVALVRALDLAPVHVQDGTLQAGPLRYVPRGRAEEEGIYGVLLGELLVDVADGPGGRDPVQAEIELVQRAAGHPALVVQSPRDVDRAIRLAGL